MYGQRLSSSQIIGSVLSYCISNPPHHPCSILLWAASWPAGSIEAFTSSVDAGDSILAMMRAMRSSIPSPRRISMCWLRRIKRCRGARHHQLELVSQPARRRDSKHLLESAACAWASGRPWYVAACPEKSMAPADAAIGATMSAYGYRGYHGTAIASA